MTQIAVLNTHTHKDLRVRAQASASLGDDQRFVAVVVSEFPFLAVHCPILFSKDAESGRFYAGAMLGFDPGENLFLSGDQGFDAYRPLNLQRAPFFTAGDDLAIDLESPRISKTDGERLFGDDDAPTPYLLSIMATFQELKPGMEKTRAFIAKLLELKLIEPITIDLAFDDGTRRMVEDVYTIDQDALQGLADAAVLDLFRRGYLHLIYLMIASLKQVPVLARRKNQRLLDV